MPLILIQPYKTSILPLSSTLVYSNFDSVDQNTHTFAAATLGSSYKTFIVGVVCGDNGFSNAAITNCTVNSQPATSRATAQHFGSEYTGYANFFTFDNTVLQLNSATIVVTTTGAPRDTAMFVYGVNSIIGAVDHSASDITPPLSVTAQGYVGSLTVGINFFYTGGGSTPNTTWTGLTKNAEHVSGTYRQSSASKISTAAGPFTVSTATDAANLGSTLLVATWKPV